jgi:hypothetical protein
VGAADGTPWSVGVAVGTLGWEVAPDVAVGSDGVPGAALAVAG